MANSINFGKIYETSYWGIGVTTNTISWGSIYLSIAGFIELTNRYKERVEADGGVVESLECLNAADFMANNWLYYFRVIDDGGIVESLECVNILTDDPTFLLRDDNGFLLQENGSKIIL